MLKLQYLKAARNENLTVARAGMVALLIGVLMLLPLMRQISVRAAPGQTGAGAERPPHTRQRVNPPPATQTIYAPVGLWKFSQAEVLLNNNSPNALEVTPTFYLAGREPLTGPVFTLNPAEVRHVAAADLAPPDQRTKKLTAMTLSYFGGMLELGAQITLLGRGQTRSVDIPFSADMDYRSTAQEAVWWMPRQGAATLILGNPTDQPVVASLKYADGSSEEVRLAPFAVTTTEHKSGAANAAAAPGVADAVRIETTGALGSLRVTGFVTSDDQRFHSGIRFYDPATIRQPHLFATNLRLKKSEPRLVLKNFGEQATTARPRFIPLAGQSAALELPAVSLEPHQATEVDLQPLREAARTRADLDMVSVQVINENSANQLIGALYSVNAKTLTTYDVPLRDSGPVRNSTGSYPWRVEGDYTTVVSITNTQEQAAKYRVSISYDGGSYKLNPQMLGAGETVVFDLRRLRDEQVPDRDGKTLPRSVSGGQFRWSMIGDDTFRLIGRSEMVSLAKRVNSSYSCPVCCPDSFGGFDFVPNYSSGPSGGTALLAVDGVLVDCYNNVTTYPWNLTETSVADSLVLSLAMAGQGSAQMGCLSAGTSQFYGTVYETWYDNDGMDCYSRYGPFGNEGTGDVQGCGDQRDTIIREYAQYHVNLSPGCADFTQTAHSDHFSFAELNGGDYAWAIIRGSLLSGLECVRTANGNVPLTISSGYRNPAHNANVPGAAPQSRHMYGDAADIASTSTNWQALHDAGKSCGACVEPLSMSGSGHVHVDWRGSCPQGW